MSEKQSIVDESSKPPGYLGTIVEASGSHEWNKANHGISWMSGACMLINAALGACLLNTPELYDRFGGIGTATITQLVIILMSMSTMYVICACSDLDDVDTYDEVLEYMCGKVVQKLSALSVMFICFGICVTFLVIIGDQTDRIFATYYGLDFCQHWYMSRNFYILLVSSLIMFPFSCVKHLPNILLANIVGVVSISYFVFLVIYQYFQYDVIPGPIKVYSNDSKQIITAIPVVIFAYQTHVNLVPIYGSLKERSLKNLMKSSITAMTVMFIMYSLVGIFGYLTFGNKIVSDVMLLYDPSDPFVFLAIIGLIVKMMSTYPQMMFCGRQSYNSFISSEPEDENSCRRVVTTGIMNIAIIFLALITSNIREAIQFLGSLSACTSFVFPGICMATLATSQSATMLWSRISCILMFIYAILVVLFGIFMFLIFIVIFSDDYLVNKNNNATFEMLCN